MRKKSCFVLIYLHCASVVWADEPGTHPAMLKKCEARASASLRNEQSFQSVSIGPA
jgi:hypothetical protein